MWIYGLWDLFSLNHVYLYSAFSIVIKKQIVEKQMKVSTLHLVVHIYLSISHTFINIDIDYKIFINKQCKTSRKMLKFHCKKIYFNCKRLKMLQKTIN